MYYLAQSKTTNQHRDNNRRRSRSRSPVRRSSPTSNRNGEYLIKMRGMPFTVVEDDIREVKFTEKSFSTN